MARGLRPGHHRRQRSELRRGHRASGRQIRSDRLECRVNLDGTRDLLEAIRRTKDYKPKLVFSSSIAVYGAPFPPEGIPDDFHLTPLTSYGAQKAAGELLLADHHRREFLDGIGLRLPTICVRPGKPNKARGDARGAVM